MSEPTHLGVVAGMQKHCQKMRYRFGILDSRQGMTVSEIRQFRNNFDDSRLALYYPWVTINNPRSGPGLPPTIDLGGVC